MLLGRSLVGPLSGRHETRTRGAREPACRPWLCQRSATWGHLNLTLPGPRRTLRLSCLLAPMAGSRRLGATSRLVLATWPRLPVPLPGGGAAALARVTLAAGKLERPARWAIAGLSGRLGPAMSTKVLSRSRASSEAIPCEHRRMQKMLLHPGVHPLHCDFRVHAYAVADLPFPKEAWRHA